MEKDKAKKALRDPLERGPSLSMQREKPMEEPSDDELAEKAASGDRGAFERLVWRWWDRIRGFCSALAGFDPELAEEAAQEALIQIHRSLSAWKRAGSLGGFLYGICRNVTKNIVRRRAKARRGFVSIDDALGLEPADPRLGAEDLAIRNDLRRSLASAMRDLDLRDRELIYLHDAEGMGIRDLAALAGLPEGTVKSRLFRIRQKLAKALKEAGYE